MTQCSEMGVSIFELAAKLGISASCDADSPVDNNNLGNTPLEENNMSLTHTQSSFQNAPYDWSPEVAEQLAQGEGIELSDEHWEELNALQEYYAKHEFDHIHVRELSDALDEKFHDKGGVRYLYTLFPKGPIAQGCRLAGLEMPAGAVDKGFGSVI